MIIIINEAFMYKWVFYRNCETDSIGRYARTAFLKLWSEESYGYAELTFGFRETPALMYAKSKFKNHLRQTIHTSWWFQNILLTFRNLIELTIWKKTFDFRNLGTGDAFHQWLTRPVALSLSINTDLSNNRRGVEYTIH